jgi:MFS family permease
MFKTIKNLFSHPMSRTVGLSFFLHSFLFGSLATRLPDIKQSLDLSDSEMGWSLLGMSVGGLTMMPFASWLIAKLGTGRANIVFSSVMCLTILIPITATSTWALLIGFYLYGISMGGQDVAMNAAADAVEKKYDLKIMSTCHGMFSIGAMFGAFTASILAGQGMGKETHMLFIVIAMIGLLLYQLPGLRRLPAIVTEENAIFVLPKGSLLVMGAVGFCIMMGEGAVQDWSAIYLKDRLMADSYMVGLGLAGFSFAMAIGRFYGDLIVPKYGAKRVVSLGALLGSIGILIAISFQSVIGAILGFTIVGIGFSCVVPVLFRNAASVPNVASGTGVAAVTSAGICGFLIGPPTIGFIGETYGLNYGLSIVAILGILAYFLSRKVVWY